MLKWKWMKLTNRQVDHLRPDRWDSERSSPWKPTTWNPAPSFSVEFYYLNFFKFNFSNLIFHFKFHLKVTQISRQMLKTIELFSGGGDLNNMQMSSLISLVGPGDAGIIRVTSFEQLDRLSVIGQSEALRQYANQLTNRINPLRWNESFKVKMTLEFIQKLPTCE